MAGRKRPSSTQIKATGECGHDWMVTYRYGRRIDEAQIRVQCKGGCRRMVRVTFEYEGRVCGRENCSNALTRYNPGPDCFACDEAKGKPEAARAAA